MIYVLIDRTKQLCFVTIIKNGNIWIMENPQKSFITKIKINILFKKGFRTFIVVKYTWTITTYNKKRAH